MVEKKDASRRQPASRKPHYHIIMGGERVAVLRHSHVWHPPTDVMEDEQNFYVMVEIAGMQEGEFHVTLKQRQLTVSGVRPFWGSGHSYHQLEVHYGTFRTDVRLPAAVDEEHVEAEYADGFLHIKLPRVLPQKIRVADGREPGTETSGER